MSTIAYIFTVIGVATVSYLFAFPLMDFLEGRK